MGFEPSPMIEQRVLSSLAPAHYVIKTKQINMGSMTATQTVKMNIIFLFSFGTEKKVETDENVCPSFE